MKGRIPKSVLAAYDIGDVRSTKLLSGGLIHETWLVDAEAGKFILQKLHPVLATDAIAEDFFAVTSYLNANGFLSPRAVATRGGKKLAGSGKARWRMQTYVSGHSFDRLEKPLMAAEAGRIFARFHATLDGMPYRFRSKKVLHETEKIHAAFKKTAAAHRKDALMADVRDDVDFVQRELARLFLPKGLPMRAIHGDPKISNVLFGANGKAKTIVDLDTCNRRTVLVELGDAFRSWCGREEDDPKNRFRLPIFKAAWKGYTQEAENRLTPRERKLVPQAVGAITLELAARFLTDYFEDRYFGWDAKRYPSRRAHNLARARGQIALYRDLQKKLPEVRRIVGQTKTRP